MDIKQLNGFFPRGILGLVLSLSLTPSWSIDIADSPLILQTSVKPNIMLMMDNSGSMTNIVPESPYDSTTVYLSSCPSGNTISAGSSVEIRISSSQPRIRIGSTNYEFGTASGEKCFDSNSSYKAKLYADNGSYPSGYLAAEYTGNFLNWYFDSSNSTPTWTSGQEKKPGTQSRMEIAKTAAKGLVDSLHNVRMGLSSYNGSTGGALNELIDDIDATKKTATKTKIDALSPSGSTPLAETLSDIGRYFTSGHTGDLTLHPGQSNESSEAVSTIFNSHSIDNNSGDSIISPIQNSCQKSFAVLLTDGRPQSDQSINSVLRNYDGDCSSGCSSYDRKNDRVYESNGSDYLDDVAQAMYEMDLRPDLVDPNGIINNLATYTIGFADDQVINDPLMQDTADQGGGEFLTAADSGQLAAALKNALGGVIKQTAAVASIATNSTRLSTDTAVYQARFNSQDWSGELLAYPVNADGTMGAQLWNAAAQMPAHDARKLYTWNGSAGISFDYSSMNATQKTAMGSSALVDYLRGDSSGEQHNGGSYRDRSTALGDIVNSDALFVGAQDFGYRMLDSSDEAVAYATYLTEKKARPTTIYVGANDGMLHAFDATSGVEKFAYIPNETIVNANLSSLASTTYTHKYFVDGPAFFGDAYVDTGSGASWKTILAGTTGAGGKAVFALDITDPNSFGASKVLWEFTDPDLGYTLGQPVVAKMADGQWAVVFGNGYNSANQRAFLFIVNLETGALIKKIDTGAGDASQHNGLASPALLDLDGDRDIDRIYAGDLLGNLWNFDVSDTSDVSNWEVAFTQSGNKYPLFTAKNSASQIQPITAPLEIGAGPDDEGGYMIHFGTGSFFAVGDNTNIEVQTFYGIWDNDNRISATDRADLQAQTITHEVTALGNEVRVSTDNAVNWSTQRGWYMDLLPPSGTAQGERVVTVPLLRFGRVIFITMIPSTVPCDLGGTSWLMELDAQTGSRLSYSALDLSRDKKFNEDDEVSIEVVIEGENTSIRVPISGIKFTEGIVKTPAVISDGALEYKIASGSTGGVAVITEKGSLTPPRTSWRQLQ